MPAHLPAPRGFRGGSKLPSPSHHLPPLPPPPPWLLCPEQHLQRPCRPCRCLGAPSAFPAARLQIPLCPTPSGDARAECHLLYALLLLLLCLSHCLGAGLLCRSLPWGLRMEEDERAWGQADMLLRSPEGSLSSQNVCRWKEPNRPSCPACPSFIGK